MSFVNQLLHALSEIPSTTTSMPITHFLPKNITHDSGRLVSLLYPLAVGHILMPEDFALSFGPLPAYGILYVTKGNGAMISGKRHFHLSDSSFALFDLQEGFSIAASGELEYDILYFNGASAAHYYEELLRTDGLFLSSLSSTGIGSFLRPLMPTGAQTLSCFAFHRLLTDLLSELVDYSATAEQTESIPDYLRQVKEYLDDNFFMDISLDSLETLFQVNRYRLCREFRTHFLMPPIQYLHLSRITKARTLLAETTLKVHEISYQVGYENTNHFIHHFKKITGQTPALYREKKVGTR